MAMSVESTFDPHHPIAQHAAFMNLVVSGKLGPLEEFTQYDPPVLGENPTGHSVIPGLFQSEEYIAEVSSWYSDTMPAGYVDHQMSNRIGRSVLLKAGLAETGAKATFFVHEDVARLQMEPSMQAQAIVHMCEEAAADHIDLRMVTHEMTDNVTDLVAQDNYSPVIDYTIAATVHDPFIKLVWAEDGGMLELEPSQELAETSFAGGKRFNVITIWHNRLASVALSKEASIEQFQALAYDLRQQA